MRQIWIIALNTIKALVRKKDFYVFFILLLVLLLFLVSESFFGVQDISRYVKDIGFFCIWLFSLIIAVTFSAKQLPEEIDSKTVLPLLAKPVPRAYLVAGRFLGSALASIAAFTVFYIVFVITAFLKGEGISIALLFQGYILAVCFLSLVCAISMFLSLYFTLSAAVTMSFIVYFAVSWFSDVLRKAAISPDGIHSLLSSVVYYMIPHYEFYDMRIRLVHGWEGLPLWTVLAIFFYTVVYVNLVLCLACFKFKKRIL